MSGGRGIDSDEADFPVELLRHRAGLQRFARRLCRNQHDAEDLVQTTLARAWQAREQFLPGGNIGGWLHRIMSNHHLDNVRRKAGVQVPLIDEMTAQPSEASDDGEPLAMAPEAVLEALSQLPPELREPLELSAIRGKRYREIAELLAIPVNTVGTRIRRARHRLMAQLAAHARHGARR